MSDLVFGRMILHDFKSFLGKHVIQLNRPPGLYYIQGKNKKRRRLGSNGVGKTTIWDGVFWVLWGTTGSDRRPANAVVPWSKPGANTWGTVTWKKNGKWYKLKRSRNPNKLTLKTKKSVRVIEQNEVSNLLGFSEEMFRRSVVLSQFEELFLDLLPEKQSRLFNEALDLEVWLRASKAADKKRRAVLEQCIDIHDWISTASGRRKEIKEQLREAKTNQRAYGLGIKRSRESLLLTIEQCGHSNPDDKQTRIGQLTVKAHNLARVQASYQAKVQASKDGLESGVCPTCGQTIGKKHSKEDIRKAKEAIALNNKQAKKYKRLEQATWARVERLQQERSKMLADKDKLAVAKHELERLDKEGNPHDKPVLKLKIKLRDIRSELAEKKADHAKLEKEVEIYSYWQDAFKEIRISLIDQVLAELELAVTTNAEALGLEGYRIQFQTERENRAGNVTVVFNVLLHTPEHDGPVKWQNYSGGERQRLQLAMAFGLSEVILDRVGINPNIEVLDEPTQHTSTEGVDDLLERLHERAAELGRAIYFCDHHSHDRGIFDGTILVTKGAGGSKLTSL